MFFLRKRLIALCKYTTTQHKTTHNTKVTRKVHWTVGRQTIFLSN